MSKPVTYAVIIIIPITLLVWLVSILINPTPLPLNVKVILLFTAFLAVTGIIANFNDIFQLLRSFTSEPENSEFLSERIEVLEAQIDEILNSQNITTERLVREPTFGPIQLDKQEALIAILEETLNLENRSKEGAGFVIDDPDWFLDMAKGFTVNNDWLSAARYYGKYIEYDPNNWEVYFLRAVAFMNSREGRNTNIEAVRSMSEAIALAPNDTDINLKARMHGYRGAALKRLKRYDEAESELLLAKKWANRPYEVDDISYNLACVYAMTHRREDMFRELRRLVTDPNWRTAIISKEHYFKNYWHDEKFRELVWFNE